jgi:methionine synthase II (cobalamin-independent)
VTPVVGSATGVGSLPGEDPLEAARLVVGELPDLPHLPELPARGPGADLIGRTAGLLVGLAVDRQPSGWRVVDRPGADHQRAVSLLRQDLDALEEAAAGYTGPLKIQVAGPLTLAASVEKSRGDKLLADYGARRDLAQSLVEGVAAHVTEVAKRVPGADVVLQLDEPSLPAVLAGAVPTISGFGRLRSVEASEAEQSLRSVLQTAPAYGVVHCCAANVPVALLQRAGARAVSFDLGLLATAELDPWGEAVDEGLALWLGIVPSVDPPVRVRDDRIAARVQDFWQALGYGREVWAERTVITPTCGLAGASPAWARQAYAMARAVAKALTEDD